MGRLLTLVRRIRLSRKVEVLVVSSRHGHFLTAVTQGRRVMVVDPTAFPLLLSIRFFFEFARRRRQVTRVSNYILALATATKARVVLASDAVRELTEVAGANEELSVVAVMHGFYVDQGEVNFREGWTTRQDSAVSLFALGEYDLTHYRRWGNTHREVFPVGSANNCLYLLQRHKKPDSRFDICLVQGALNPNPADEFARARLTNWEKIAEFVSRLAELQGLSVGIALNTSSKEGEIRDWFSRRIPGATFIASSSNPFATYEAIDGARVSIGEASTSLIEGLARRNKCVAMNFTSLDLLSLPVPALVSMKNPDFNEFEDRINSLLDMPHEDFWAAVKDGVERLINVEEQHLTISRIRDFVAERCDTRSPRRL